MNYEKKQALWGYNDHDLWPVNHAKAVCVRCDDDLWGLPVFKGGGGSLTSKIW